MRWRGFSGRERGGETSSSEQAPRGRVISSDYAPVEIESFEYAPVGRVMALARLAGRWRNIHPSEQLELALQIDAGEEEQRVPALPNAAGSREWPRWQFGFPIPQSILRQREAKFTLQVGSQLSVALPAPEESTLEAWGIGDGHDPAAMTGDEAREQRQLLEEARLALDRALRREDEQLARTEGTASLEAQLAVERQARNRFEQELADAQQQRSWLETALVETRDARSEAERKLAVGLEERLALEAELSALRGEREQEQQAHSAGADRVEALDAELADARAARARAEGERDAAVERNQRLESELIDVRGEREQEREAQVADTGRVRALEGRLAELETAEGERDAAVEQTQRLEADLAEERNRSQEAVGRVEHEARRASELERTLRAALEREQAARERAERELTRRSRVAEDERTTLGKRIEEVQSQADARTREFETALSELRTRHDAEQSAERRLRALVESWVGVEQAESDERRAQEELTRAMFSAGGEPPESDEHLQRIVAWEQAARYAAERARESFDRAWEEARDAVEPGRAQGEREPAPEVRPST